MDEIAQVFGIFLVAQEIVGGCESSCMVAAIADPVYEGEHPVVDRIGGGVLGDGNAVVEMGW